MSKLHFANIFLAITGVFSQSSALGASYINSEFNELKSTANQNGVASVLITLDDTISLDNIKNHGAYIKNEMQQKGSLLLNELGEDALSSGYWNNGYGQMGVYVNAEGLNKLSKTNLAISFGKDITRKSRARVNNQNTSLDEIEVDINKKGFANVEIFLNVDNFEYDIPRGNSKLTYRPLGNFKNSVDKRLSNIRKLIDKPTIKFDKSSLITKRKPSVTAHIDKETFYSLIESPDVRALQPVGFIDKRSASWSSDVLSSALKHNKDGVEVIISLKGGEIFTPKTGYISEAARVAQSLANRRAFEGIFSAADIDLESALLNDYSEIGSIHIKLHHKDLLKLYRTPDPRIISVSLNEGGIRPALVNSTGLINMQSAWDTGYTGAGQNIVIMDTGLRLDHSFFNVSGTSKIVNQACYGTNSGNYVSICPNQDSNGDSPLGTANSGQYNAALYPHRPSKSAHGTHVAGIAAGKQNGLLSGVAYDANIIAVQVFSYKNDDTSLIGYDADILAALSKLDSSTTTGTQNNPFTANLSLGYNHYGSSAGSCDNKVPAVTSYISSLTSKGVPVVVATMNEGYSNGISWPSCVSEAIKVAAVLNDQTGTTVWQYSNTADPDNFTGPIFLAPGASVQSANVSGAWSTTSMSGTSQATPHVAGVYAAFKSSDPNASVPDMTAWLMSSGSINVSARGYNFRRINIPSL